jgi:hypothetical protein
MYSRAPLLCLLFASHLPAAISPDHPELVQQQILAAYAAGQKSVVVPAGIYNIPHQAGSGAHLDFENLSNFEIDARGATFVFQDVTTLGINFFGCDRVFFHGATLYYGTTPFSQGVIQAVASNASLDVQIEAGYPTNLDDPKYYTPNLIGHLFDSSTRWWKRNSYGDVYGNSTQRLGPNTFRVLASNTAGAAVGDLIGFRSGIGDHMIRVTASSRMTLMDLTILNSSEFGVTETAGGDLGSNHYLSITIKRGNPPPGAATGPLFSTNADGLHSVQARQGPDVENCYFESMPDDGIAVHGVYSWVIEGPGNTLVVSNPTVAGGTNFNVGDPLRLVDASDQPVGEAVITAVTALPNYHNSRKSARQTVRDFTVGPYYQITLDRTLPAAFDYVASNPNESGAGFILLNNTIKNHRERGMNLKADNGLVQGNVIDGSTVAGIRVGPEFYWAEAGYSRNVTIRNNTITNVGYWGGQTAALLIAPDQGLTQAGSYQNIVIDGNLFENFDTTAIFISSASGVTVSNNSFVNLQNAAPFAPNNQGITVIPGTLVAVAKSTGVQFQANTTSQLGAYNTGFVQAATGAIVSGVPYVSAVADSSADFSSTQGASNWSYGYFPSGNLNAFTILPTYNAQFNRWQHVTFGPPWTFLDGNSNAHPNGTNDGTEEWATRRWISAAAGVAKISGHLAKNDTDPRGTGVYGRIYLNHALIYEHFLAPTDGTGTNYSVPATLSAGDVLDFALAPNGVDSFDSTHFDASVSVLLPAISSTLAPVSASPPSGTATIQAATYTFTFADPAGYQDIGVANVLVNSFVDGRAACYVALVPRDASSWSLFLVDDAGDAAGPYAGAVIPGNLTVSNSQCSISAAGSSVTGSGSILTVMLAIAFKPGFAGDRVINMAVQTRAGTNSGWHAKGVVRVAGGALSTTTAVSGMTPARAIAFGSTEFVTTFSDSNGTSDIGVANILINSSLNGAAGCYLAYANQSGTLYLMNDAGTVLLPGQSLAASGTLANSQCTVSWGNSPVAISGNNISLALNIHTGAAWAGQDLIAYAAVRDKNEANNTGWHAVATASAQ